VFAVFAPFVRHRFVSCSFTCALTAPVFLIMERISPTVHLGVVSCIFCTTLAAFLALLCAILRKLPIRGRRLQTLVLLLKLVLDLMSTTLGALKFSKRKPLDDGKSEAYFVYRQTIIDGLTNRDHSIGRLHPALLLLHMYNELRGKSSLRERYQTNTHNQLQHFYLWSTYRKVSEKGLGWAIHRPGLTVTIVLNLLLFLPLIE